MVSMLTDRARSIAVLVTAVTQIASAALTVPVLGSSANTGAISDANANPVTPAGYAFAIWGLIYLLSLGLAVYQLLPTQRTREVHRRTGWLLVLAFAASTVWVPIFGTQTIWLSQIVILVLLGSLMLVASRLTSLPAARTTAERFLLRLPVTVYLGWALLATTAGFALTFRSFGMGESGAGVTVVSIVLVLAATAVAVLVVTRLTAAAGFAFTALWALVAIVVATYEAPVAVITVAAIAIVIVVLVARTARSAHKDTVLMG